MLKAKGMPLWAQHMAVAVGYAVAGYFLQQWVISHFQPYSGLRLALLLMLPRRFWPALAVGELASLGQVAIECGPLYGWGWAAMRAFPPILLAMPIVHAFRNHWPRLNDRLSANIAPMLACTLAVATVWATFSLATFMSLRVPAGYVPPPYYLLAARYFLGQCVGIITFTPILLWLNETLTRSHWREVWNEFIVDRLALESTVILLPSLAFLTWLAIKGSGELTQVARMAMFLPVAALTLRNGWRGAVIGSAMASICVMIAMPAARDPATVSAQAFITLTSGILMLLGSRISLLHEREQRQRMDERRAMQLAQNNILQSERRLHQAAEALEDMRDIMAVSQDFMFDRIQRMLSPTEQRNFRRDNAQTQQRLYQLASGLSPRLRREQDLPVTLSNGNLARALDEAGVAYHCEVQNRIPGQLGPVLPLALYRLACEAALHMCAEYRTRRIHLRLRLGMTGDQVWALLTLDGREAENEPLANVSVLQRHLGASGMDLDTLRSQTKIYGGNLRVRSREEGPRITLLLTDEADSQAAA
ncbi:MASE1 domain-containing protein [Dyella sp.]|uniref:MASE1 domain-containing protein n=1 Tax=Dyella sp. TaxID=1869338 RepID=UPI002ED08520